MTTLSAGAAAGLLVTLMVLSTSDRSSAELHPAATPSKSLAQGGDRSSFNPQPDPPRAFGDGSVKPARQ